MQIYQVSIIYIDQYYTEHEDVILVVALEWVFGQTEQVFVLHNTLSGCRVRIVFAYLHTGRTLKSDIYTCINMYLRIN